MVFWIIAGIKMAYYTGYLLGKVQLDGAIRSEVLANLVETLIQKYQTSEPSKKPSKFNEHHKYVINHLIFLRLLFLSAFLPQM